MATAMASVMLENDLVNGIPSSGVANITHFKNRHVPLPPISYVYVLRHVPGFQ
jgi:hypothetical protein